MGTMRGTELQIGNRFEERELEAFDDGWDSAAEIDPTNLPVVETQFFPDHSKTILAKNDSPDIPFGYSVNPYRGCEHGCAYCYARPTHEYLGFNPALDFESKIMIKHDAPELLRKAFQKKSWKPQMITLSGNTDCYQPAERKFRITRRILEVCLEFRNPVGIITKNALVMRDIDVLSELAKKNLVMVYHSVTTLDRRLTRKLEPRTSTPERRLLSIKTLTDHGVPCGVMIGPVIPGLNDEEILPILKASSEAGAVSAGYNMVRLPYAVRPIFTDWLERNVPLEASKVLARLEMVRDGKLTDSTWSTRMRGEGAYADYINKTFKVACKKYHLNEKRVHITTEHFRHSSELNLFDQE